MSIFLQSVLVGLAVALCALFSLWRLLSARVKLRLLDGVVAVSRGSAPAWLGALRERTLAGLGSGCGSCAQHGGQASEVIRQRATFTAPAPNRTPGAPRR